MAENTQHLSIESFSCSWLINLKPSIESLDNSFRASLDASDETSFIEMDPTMPPSKRFLREPQDCNFHFPISQSPRNLVHADELFSNGLILPHFLGPFEMEAYDGPNAVLASPNSSYASENLLSVSKIRCSSLRCRRLPKRILQKYLCFLRPLCRRLCGHGASSRVEIASSSPESSPRRSTAYSVDNWRTSCDSESSIHEAILHCKRSIGK